MVINSRRNERVKFFASLKQKKFRKEHGLYLVEGVKMVREAFKYNQKVVAIIGTGEYLSEYVASGVELIEVSADVLQSISDAVTPQGIIAVLEMPDVKPKKLGKLSVCLDGVSDAGNLGTILRVMLATGVSDIYLIDCVDPYSPKVVRSSMSGVFMANIYEVTFEQFCELSADSTIVVADMDGENVFETADMDSFCLVLGSEAHGVSENMKKLANKCVKIPMKNQLESLNVGVSAGVILYNLLKNTL